MENKFNIKKLTSGVGKTAKGLFENAIQTIDQNEDGKFNLEDVTAIAESVGESVRKGTQAVKETADEKTRLLELKSLQPVFLDTLDSAEFLMPKFIRIAERDKRHAESEMCQGSIGYASNQKGLDIINIFRDSIDSFGLMFYPDCDSEFYYVDPSDRDRYISLDEYFGYLKVARINELQKIAQDLGAKYFKVTYKEEQNSFTEKKMKSNIMAKPIVNVELDAHAVEKKYSTVEIAAETEFPGHPPIKPELRYMLKDPSIQTLVSMRMDEKSPLGRQKFMLKMSTSSGIKEHDAIKIDAVLKALKWTGNTTVSSEAKMKQDDI